MNYAVAVQDTKSGNYANTVINIKSKEAALLKAEELNLRAPSDRLYIVVDQKDDFVFGSSNVCGDE